MWKESVSPYNSPLCIVPKKPDPKGNKKGRIVIVFQALIEKLLRLPIRSRILQTFSKIDPTDLHKTAFSTLLTIYNTIE